MYTPMQYDIQSYNELKYIYSSNIDWYKVIIWILSMFFLCCMFSNFYKICYTISLLELFCVYASTKLVLLHRNLPFWKITQWMIINNHSNMYIIYIFVQSLFGFLLADVYAKYVNVKREAQIQIQLILCLIICCIFKLTEYLDEWVFNFKFLL